MWNYVFKCFQLFYTSLLPEFEVKLGWESELRISALKDGYGAEIDCIGIQGLIHQRQLIGKLGLNWSYWGFRSEIKFWRSFGVKSERQGKFQIDARWKP